MSYQSNTPADADILTQDLTELLRNVAATQKEVLTPRPMLSLGVMAATIAGLWYTAKRFGK